MRKELSSLLLCLFGYVVLPNRAQAFTDLDPCAKNALDAAANELTAAGLDPTSAGQPAHGFGDHSKGALATVQTGLNGQPLVLLNEEVIVDRFGPSALCNKQLLKTILLHEYEHITIVAQGLSTSGPCGTFCDEYDIKLHDLQRICDLVTSLSSSGGEPSGNLDDLCREHRLIEEWLSENEPLAIAQCGRTSGNIPGCAIC